MANVAAFSILLLTVSLSLARPQLGSVRIHPASAATIGALLTVATGLIPFQMVGMAARLLLLPVVTILSLMVITLVAERAGLFRLLATRVATAARGDARKLFAYLFFAGALVGTFFTNDAAILIFTPLVVNLLQEVQDGSWTARERIPFYFAVLYIANVAGALVISNPINIIVASLFQISFLTYAAWMVLPAAVSIAVSFLGLRLVFRRSLPRTYAVPCVRSGLPGDATFARASAVVLVLTLAGFFTEHVTGVPTWLVALLGAAILLAIYATRPACDMRGVFSRVGWDVILFVFGIFIVAMGLRNAGLTHLVGAVVAWLGQGEFSLLTYVTAVVTGVLSSAMNNHPTADMMTWVIRDLSLAEGDAKLVAMASLIGGGLGPKMLPIGSLAALIWFRILRNHGIEIPYSLYIRIGVPVTIVAILLAVATLNIEVVLHRWLTG
jgi:arsenical pump membrane protein